MKKTVVVVAMLLVAFSIAAAPFASIGGAPKAIQETGSVQLQAANLQQSLQQQMQIFRILSTVMKVKHDTASAIIRNLGG
jgi:nitrate/nitrite-specific signal transduction histidine kinase